MTSYCFKESTFRKEIIDRAVDCSVTEDNSKEIGNTFIIIITDHHYNIIA